ncbi:MAG: hypothetical protein VKJ24_16875 [Synechococcales bacterium]|nr:hypothetical protein [Synechococcales bacterium]
MIRHPTHTIATLLASTIAIALPPLAAQAEGSRTFYPNGFPTGAARANIEWRDDKYGNLVKRRTVVKVFAKQGENILLGSSAIGVKNGNIRVYNPGVANDITVGAETFPALTPTPSTTAAATNGFDCKLQQPAKGFINTRAKELAGPKSADGLSNTSGYDPCVYVAPVTGIYNVAFYGPEGEVSTLDGGPTGVIEDTSPTKTPGNNINDQQRATVAMWDVTVRSNASTTVDNNGRVFAYYWSLFTAGNGRPLYFPLYPITNDGFRYELKLRGLDPNGFILFGNQVGFWDSDGKTPLYHDILGDNNALSSIKGGAKLASPQYATFLNPIDLDALPYLDRIGTDGKVMGSGIPSNPILPTLSGLSFSGNVTTAASTSTEGAGGTFTFTTNVAGNYQIIISRDGIDFDPTKPTNRVIRGVMTSPGTQTITWDGFDNNRDPFPVGVNYSVKAQAQSGEYHFPAVDAENNFYGGPTLTLLNPGVNNPLGNTTAFYDDRVYKTLNGTKVHTTGTIGNVLCSGNNSAPTVFFSNPLTGFNSTTNQRAYGTATGGNGQGDCNGSFGDTKGLDLWTYYPSTASQTTLNIIGLPIVGAAKKVNSLVANGDGTYTVNYLITIKNYGINPLKNVQVTEDLLSTFNTATPATIISTTAPVITVTNPGTSGTTSITSAGATFTGQGGTTNTGSVNNLLNTSATNTLGVGSSFTIAFNVTIRPTTSATFNNTVVATAIDTVLNQNAIDISTDGSDPDNTVGAGNLNGNSNPTDNTSPTPITITFPLPALKLVKRITKINSTAYTSFTEDPSSVDDNAPNWPIGYLGGIIQGEFVKPKDLVEYTIYFLSDGNAAVKHLNLCDWVPAGTTYTPGSLRLSIGNPAITPEIVLTDGADSDRGQFFLPNSALPTTFPTTTAHPLKCAPPTLDGNNNQIDALDGAIVVNVADDVPNATSPGSPNQSYGYIRFQTQVK